MTLRGSAGRRSPDGALVGVLRELSGQQRRAGTRPRRRRLGDGQPAREPAGVAEVEGPRCAAGPPGAPGPPGAVGPRGARGARGPAPAADVVTTDPYGVATWQPPARGRRARPNGWVVSATPAGDRPLLAVVDHQDDELGSGQVAVRVWELSDGLPVPAPGVAVHLVAVPAPR